MSSLPPDIIPIIFNYIKKITDKRQFLRTCKLYNNLTKDQIKLAETKFFDNFVSNERNIKTLCYCLNMKINKIKKNKLIKFTLEICSDEYFHLLPLSYLNPNNNQIIGFLVDYNKLELLQIAFKNGCKISNIICSIAMSNGYLEIFKWAIKNNYEWNGSNFGLAIQKNHVHIIEYVIKYIKKYNWILIDYVYICAHATHSGNLDLVKLLVRQNFPLTKTCAWAAKSGHLDILKWLRKYNCSWDTKTCSKAAKYGHLHILQWARENGCPWDVTTCNKAAKGGHLHILKWAIENGCEWDKFNCLMAAKKGHLHILQWAIDNGCELNAKIWEEATRQGHLDILKWAVKNGYTFNHNVCEIASFNSRYDIVKWALENDFEIGNNTCKLIAYDVNAIEILKLVLDKGGIWNDKFTSLIHAKNNYDYGDYFNTQNDYRTIGGELKILKWAKKHGYPI